MATRQMLHAYWVNAWSATNMSEWATQLLVEGNDSREIRMLAARPDYAWDQAQSLFRRICSQLCLSDDIDRDIQQVVEWEWVKSYKRSEISGAEMISRLSELQKRLGLPLVILEIDLAKSIPERYYTLDGLEGEALESLIHATLTRHGLLK